MATPFPYTTLVRTCKVGRKSATAQDRGFFKRRHRPSNIGGSTCGSGLPKVAISQPLGAKHLTVQLARKCRFRVYRARSRPLCGGYRLAYIIVYDIERSPSGLVTRAMSLLLYPKLPPTLPDVAACEDRKSTRLNSIHECVSRMTCSACKNKIKKQKQQG